MSETNRVIATVAIGNIRLVEIDANTRIRNVLEAGKLATVNIRHETGLPEAPKADGTFEVLAEFSLNVVSEGAQEPHFSLAAKFELGYILPTDLKYTDEEMKQFVASNAVFNAWPYFREIVQSTMSRMNLPPIMLPLYRITKDPLKVPSSND